MVLQLIWVFHWTRNHQNLWLTLLSSPVKYLLSVGEASCCDLRTIWCIITFFLSEFCSTHKNSLTFSCLLAKTWSGPNAAGHLELPAVAPSGDFKGASDRQKEIPPPSSLWTKHAVFTAYILLLVLLSGPSLKETPLFASLLSPLFKINCWPLLRLPAAA